MILLATSRAAGVLLVSLFCAPGAPAQIAPELPAASTNATRSLAETPMQTGQKLARISFEFANPALSPASYRIDFDSTGVGHYHSDPGEGSAPDATGTIPEPFDQQIEIRSPLREQLLTVAHGKHFLAGECESRQHKVAFTGKKTLSYEGPDSHGSCTFNWSQDAQLMKAADAFIAVSQTLEQGRRLRLSYLHDRLSLDAELETLANGVKAGTALELENIAPELEAIASDSAIMKRAQMRAATLLAGAPGVAQTAAGSQSH